jgi:hypothetical protein
LIPVQRSDGVFLLETDWRLDGWKEICAVVKRSLSIGIQMRFPWSGPWFDLTESNFSDMDFF